jgi:hypothetical protein
MQLKERIVEAEFDVMNDNNYPGSELTLEQEADLIASRFLDYKNGKLETHSKEESWKIINKLLSEK